MSAEKIRFNWGAFYASLFSGLILIAVVIALEKLWLKKEEEKKAEGEGRPIDPKAAKLSLAKPINP